MPQRNATYCDHLSVLCRVVFAHAHTQYSAVRLSLFAAESAHDDRIIFVYELVVLDVKTRLLLRNEDCVHVFFVEMFMCVPRHSRSMLGICICDFM